jgi:hypothetical protein
MINQNVQLGIRKELSRFHIVQIMHLPVSEISAEMLILIHPSAS